MAYELGDYLKQLRGKRSLREVAKLSKGEISHNYVRDAENGYTARGNKFVPSPEKLKVFARIYNVSYAHLMQLAGYAEETPDWATHEDVIKVETFLDEQADMTLGGESLPPEKAQRIRDMIRGQLYEELERMKNKGSR